MGEPYLINPNCSDPNVGTSQNIIDAIGAAARAWMNEGNANFTFTYGGATALILPNDGVIVGGGGPSNGANDIMFVQGSQNYWYFVQNPSVIAVTWAWYYAPDLNFEMDMAFNDGNFIFSAVGEPQSNEMDIWNMAAHEFGHFLTLGETTNIRLATMCPASSYGETLKRDLDPDDVAGIQYIYGAAANINPVLSSPLVTPTTGGLATVFSYRVNYYDSNNGFSLARATINGTPHDMTLYSGTPTTGTYKSDTTLPYAPTQQYGFYCEDGQGGSDILPVLGYFNGPQVIPLTLDLVCTNPVVPQGSTLSFDITLANQNTTNGYPITVVAYVILPNGNQYGPVLGPANINIGPGGTIFRTRGQYIPPVAPLGNYTYFMNVTSGGNLIVTDSFPFTVTGTNDGDASVQFPCAGNLDE
jgi:hypothetical protein